MNSSSLIFLGLFSLMFFTIGGTPPAQAAAINPFITWQTNTYMPAAYHGKALPSYGAKVTVSLAAISHGTSVSFANQMIRWYLNSGYVNGGTGKTQISFPLQISPGSSLRVEARIPNYPGGQVTASIFLPAINPQLVINAPYPYRTFLGGMLDLTALPYFFKNIASSAQNITWSINRQIVKGGDDPFLLHYQSAPTGTVSVAANAEIGNESASANIFLSSQ